jgi:hypothetical protein
MSAEKPRVDSLKPTERPKTPTPAPTSASKNGGSNVPPVKKPGAPDGKSSVPKPPMTKSQSPMPKASPVSKTTVPTPTSSKSTPTAKPLPAPAKAPPKPASAVKKSPQAKPTQIGSGQPLKTKQQAIIDILKRWWYCMPEWPPKDFDYVRALKDKKYRKVELLRFKLESQFDKDGLEKVFELAGFPGCFKTVKV